MVISSKDRKVTFLQLTERTDTTTTSDELLFHIFDAITRYECSLTQERVMAGLEADQQLIRIGGRLLASTGEKLSDLFQNIYPSVTSMTYLYAKLIPASPNDQFPPNTLLIPGR